MKPSSKGWGGFFFLLLIPLLGLAQPYGLTQRVPNTTLQMPQTPATYGYALTNAFPGATFVSPIAVATPPGETNRLFVLERAGRLAVITNLAAPNRTVFMDIANRITNVCEGGLLGMAFHPGYATNGYFFLFYSLHTNTAAGTGLHQRISRFQVSANTNQASANSELPLITQRDEQCNHNGGDLHFGPDGYLYISVGDEGGQNDIYTNSQTIDRDFFSGILRIDVDKRGTNIAPKPHSALMNATNYFIPSDNPFVGATALNGTNINTNTLRAEFWAIGLRNPWRFSFDTNGVLYCGDVGGSLREEINIITKGGNYGWVWREGATNGPVSTRRGPAGFSYIRPIVEYSHGSATNQGDSVTGGIVYRGDRISQLTGKYIFADYASDHIWALTPDGTNTVPFTRLLGQVDVAAFGKDPRNGDVLAVILSSSTLGRLIYSTNVTSGSALPATLAQTGAFSSLSTLTPNPGVVPYDINVPFWSDNARKTRWFSIPNTNLTMTFSRDGNWSFPTGTVWIKHFDLELTNGVPSSAKRLETRLLVRNASGVYGVTYRWGNSATNATLVGEEGLDEAFVINDGGTLRTQVWHYPRREECLSCHTAVAGWALGFNTAQMNCSFDYGGTVDNQVRSLNHAGYFSANVTNQSTLRALAHVTNSAYSVEYRVRSYLAANCVQCHQPGGSALGSWDARITQPLSLLGIINGALNNDLGDTNNRVIVPNDPAHSMLLTRISTNGISRMPPIASNLLDTNSINLVNEWISSLNGYLTFSQWQMTHFGSTNAPQTGVAEDFDGDRSSNFAEYLLGTDPVNAASFWNISIKASGGMAEIQFLQVANRGFEVQAATNLASPTVWRSLDVSGNRPLISATTFSTSVSDVITNDVQYYRVRLSEP